MDYLGPHVISRVLSREKQRVGIRDRDASIGTEAGMNWGRGQSLGMWAGSSRSWKGRATRSPLSVLQTPTLAHCVTLLGLR